MTTEVEVEGKKKKTCPPQERETGACSLKCSLVPGKKIEFFLVV